MKGVFKLIFLIPILVMTSCSKKTSSHNSASANALNEEIESISNNSSFSATALIKDSIPEIIEVKRTSHDPRFEINMIEIDKIKQSIKRLNLGDGSWTIYFDYNSETSNYLLVLADRNRR